MSADKFGLFVTAKYIGLTSLIAFWLRKVLHYVLPSQSLSNLMLQEMIAAGELCADCFELIIVADNYGVAMYALYLFLLSIWWSLNWGKATACPYTHLEDIVEGKIGTLEALCKIWAEMIGAIIVYRYVQWLWRWEMTSIHRDKADQPCTSDLQVPAVIGAIIEGAATFVYRTISKVISNTEPRIGVILDSFAGTTIVVIVLKYSGGYLNPILATTMKFGCKDHTTFEHILVYWVGASTGAVGSVFTYKSYIVQNIVLSLKGY